MPRRFERRLRLTFEAASKTDSISREHPNRPGSAAMGLCGSECLPPRLPMAQCPQLDREPTNPPDLLEPREIKSRLI